MEVEGAEKYFCSCTVKVVALLHCSVLLYCCGSIVLHSLFSYCCMVVSFLVLHCHCCTVAFFLFLLVHCCCFASVAMFLLMFVVASSLVHRCPHCCFVIVLLQDKSLCVTSDQQRLKPEFLSVEAIWQTSHIRIKTRVVHEEDHLCSCSSLQSLTE